MSTFAMSNKNSIIMNKENYRKINEPINSNLYSVQDKEYKWGVIDENDNIVVEFGKYAWIDGFQNGLAKVISHKDNTSPSVIMVYDLEAGKEIKERRAEQGIINEKGEEVLPLEYNIWKFYGKDFPTIKAFKGGAEYKFSFEQLNPNCIEDDDVINDDYDDCESNHYEEFAGTYSQDVAGFSDEDIYDAFDGDPEAYWNID